MPQFAEKGSAGGRRTVEAQLAEARLTTLADLRSTLRGIREVAAQGFVDSAALQANMKRIYRLADKAKRVGLDDIHSGLHGITSTLETHVRLLPILKHDAISNKRLTDTFTTSIDTILGGIDKKSFDELNRIDRSKPTKPDERSTAPKQKEH